MKKIKKIFFILMVILLTGCVEQNTMEDITIYTTSYPIEYVTNRLYGEHSKVQSIYPDGMQKGYRVSDKLIEDYSKGDLFIFNGLMEYYQLDTEGNLVLTNNIPTLVSEENIKDEMTTFNNKLKIIDVSLSIMYDNDVNELWLDPINLLTISNNIKKGFYQYIDSKYLLTEIDNNYQTLKEELLKLDADYREVGNRANYNVIVVDDDAFKYLEKYNITVISLEDNDKLNQKAINDVKSLIENESVKYIYVVDSEKINNTITSLQEEYEITILELNDLDNLTEEDRKNNNDYFTLMYNNLDVLKEELYK